MTNVSHEKAYSARILVERVMHSGNDETHLTAYLAAQSPAIRSITVFDSLQTNPNYPLEAGSPRISFRLNRAETACFGPLKHALCKDALFEIHCQDDIVLSEAGNNLVLKGSLLRCCGDGKHIFKMLHLLAPGSHFPPPPLTNEEAYTVFGLPSKDELEYAHKLWKEEGEQIDVASNRIQKRGERPYDALRRKPKLRKWINTTAVGLHQRSINESSSRHPAAKKSHMIIIGTALKTFYSPKIGPVELIPFSNPKEQQQKDVLIQLPDGLEENTAVRRQAWADRKRPQLQWMLQQIDDLIVRSGKEKNSEVVVLDVGGGRGDLAVWLGLKRPCWKTVAIDIHPPSIKGGKEAIERAGVGHLADVISCDASDLISKDDGVRENAKRRIGNFDIVVGLHCCGGLSETALVVALEYRVPFCVCTCCFCSHPGLCRLLPPTGREWKTLLPVYKRELAAQSQNTRNTSTVKIGLKETRKYLLQACEREGARAGEDAVAAGMQASEGLLGKILPRANSLSSSPQMAAMATVNMMRLDAFSRLAKTREMHYETKIVSFDASVSTRNLVVIGTPCATPN